LAISLFTDPQVHLAFLTSLLSRIDTKTSKEAHVLLLASIAHAKLLYGDLEGTKSDMDAAWKILDTLEGVDNGVNAAYYNVGAYYYKVSTLFSPNSYQLGSNIIYSFFKAKAEYAPYYKNSLLYLACVDLEKDMSPDERLIRAHDLSVSALLGDTIYNFGELVSEPMTNLNPIYI
jgi:26S proteasome regulatory subunit N9